MELIEIFVFTKSLAFSSFSRPIVAVLPGEITFILLQHSLPFCLHGLIEAMFRNNLFVRIWCVRRDNDEINLILFLSSHAASVVKLKCRERGCPISFYLERRDTCAVVVLHNGTVEPWTPRDCFLFFLFWLSLLWYDS